DPLLEFLQALGNGLPSPAEAAFGLAGVTRAELQGDLGEEETPLVTTQAVGGCLQQGIVAFVEGFHADVPGITSGQGSPNPARHYNHTDVLVLGKSFHAGRLSPSHKAKRGSAPRFG